MANPLPVDAANSILIVAANSRQIEEEKEGCKHAVGTVSGIQQIGFVRDHPVSVAAVD